MSPENIGMIVSAVCQLDADETFSPLGHVL